KVVFVVKMSRMRRLLLGALLLLTTGRSVNFFSLKQDVEIGAESSKEAEQSLQLIKTYGVNQYVSTIGQRIVQNRTLPPLKYHLQIVNSKDVNSLGFPGGEIYLYRGLVDLASNDDEVAALIAHEVGHVASRHGTQQLSRQLLVQEPIAIAAGVPISEVWKEQITKRSEERRVGEEGRNRGGGEWLKKKKRKSKRT